MYYNKVEICGVNTADLKVLSDEEKRSLLLRTKEGDESARQELIFGNLRLVLSIIQRFTNRRENLDDLFLQPDRVRGIHAYCFGLTNCKVKDIGAIAASGLRLSELIICGPADAQEQARWRAVPALTHRYYVLKD